MNYANVIESACIKINDTNICNILLTLLVITPNLDRPNDRQLTAFLSLHKDTYVHFADGKYYSENCYIRESFK